MEQLMKLLHSGSFVRVALNSYANFLLEIPGNAGRNDGKELK